ncbi:MAG TPA: hypothetical protein VGQ39_01880 [Pyrinomonadaceae bacterium]|jgi:hypothetical protein|nr:hypothetical protein [Pyrinomonadaceae bacterium]
MLIWRLEILDAYSCHKFYPLNRSVFRRALLTNGVRERKADKPCQRMLRSPSTPHAPNRRGKTKLAEKWTLFA